MKDNLYDKYVGVVLYLDLLGFSVLTNNNISLNSSDYNPWLGDGCDQKQTRKRIYYKNADLAFSILLEVRNLLKKLSDILGVKYQMVSDSIFVWSDNPTKMISFASRFMTSAIKNGIFCRGGIAYGEILDEKNGFQTGSFLLGDAVTKAVSLEKKSKGCRIFFDSKLPRISSIYSSYNSILKDIFVPLINPITFETYDEFKWYIHPDLPLEINRDLSKKKKLLLTKERILLANNIMRNPRFSWNAKNESGKQQLTVSLNFLSENKIWGIEHEYNWTNLIESQRSYSRQKGVEDKINAWYIHQLENSKTIT